jgi:hypothetical protein
MMHGYLYQDSQATWFPGEKNAKESSGYQDDSLVSTDA